MSSFALKRLGFFVWFLFNTFNVSSHNKSYWHDRRFRKASDSCRCHLPACCDPSTASAHSKQQILPSTDCDKIFLLLLAKSNND